jgi:hypothetical protein
MCADRHGLVSKLSELLAYFHRGSLDVPEALFGRGCVFRINGIAYEETLGRSVNDPLVRLVGRGPAAYRLLAQGLRYAIPDLTIELEDVVDAGGSGLVTCIARLRGLPRGAAGPLDAGVDVALVTGTDGRLVEVGVQATDELLRVLSAARGA